MDAYVSSVLLYFYYFWMVDGFDRKMLGDQGAGQKCLPTFVHVPAGGSVIENLCSYFLLRSIE